MQANMIVLKLSCEPKIIK